MTKYLKIPAYLLLMVFLAMACSTKKDTAINRNFHALNTKFNILYNGQVALEEGQEQLAETYVDNYWEILPVERMEIRDEIIIDTAKLNPNFRRAEEKATKAIQKHGMNIGGQERNPQIDEAYLLLGKARYYDQRFVPALEAFNYILLKYTDSDIIHQAGIWREKTNLRMENEEVALTNFKKILQLDITDQQYADASAMMAQAYINLKQKDSAIYRLKLAANITRKNEEKGRYNYIIGQLYDEKGELDSANMAFDKVIALNRKSPRIYMMNAYVEKIKNQYQRDEEDSTLLEFLDKLERNRENRPYLGKLYRLNAAYYLKKDSIALAQYYLNQSLRNTESDPILNALNYEDLAVMYFDNAYYKDAGAYYDSTLTNLNPNSKKFRTLTRKRENLESVIKYEAIASRNDSILNVLAMSDEQQNAYYQKYIDSIKAVEDVRREKEKIALMQQNSFGTLGGINSNKKRESADFYFYNQASVQYGIQEFRKIWGNRALEDNWRLNKKAVGAIQQQQITEIAAPEDSNLYKVSYYTDQLPTEPEAIDSIVEENNFAYYQLGLIYKEKFQEYDLAINKLETLLDNNPEERLVLPAKYNLFKIYQQVGSPLADQYKADIIANHAGSRYAEILKNPEAVLANDGSSPDAVYAALYKDFENQQYEKVILEADESISKYNGEDVMLKFEMLKATAKARLYGLEAYKEALNYVALNYPNSEEGEEAQNILDNTIPMVADSTFTIEPTSSNNWKVIYPFASNQGEELQTLKKTIEESLVDLKYGYVSLSEDIYNPNTIFLVVHGFDSKLRAEGYAELLNINKDYLVEHEKFVISSPNYRKVQIHKNLPSYLAEYNTNNPNLNN
ncbi:type IX secretion system periplasmic lipoprotein PorW/SprE [Galbibacter mesophilus]|uniref:type IX secretion system periplasmic lipoprotein PorW/SprE n=1 Tax=Galbibacter mesophilus TaxID=379069 RepID=UPI00293D7B57|nr:tetratricopeptide repeat protein [Galbibacter mesophilus]